ncbi:MAG TPA: hypothetical protein PLF10_10020, partial [Dokdonella sp.]|nr:hypothetical protein [Dokdonella sp.]
TSTELIRREQARSHKIKHWWERACSRQYVFRPSQGSTVTGQVEFQPGIPWMRNPDKGEQRRNPAWALKSPRIPLRCIQATDCRALEIMRLL